MRSQRVLLQRPHFPHIMCTENSYAREHVKKVDRKIVPWLPPGGPLWFPSADKAKESGLLAAGGDLSPERLVLAYSKGIFPWYDDGTPILWWSPQPRCVLFPQELHVPRRLERTLRSARFTFSLNKAFSDVIRFCASVPRPGQHGTWLVPEMIEAYERLHRRGVAHSFEAWHHGTLVGGLYGIALGQIFFGESMFHLQPDASKAAVVTFVRALHAHNFRVLDCQQTTPHMVALGAREIPRGQFLRLVEEGIALPNAMSKQKPATVSD